MPDSLKVVPSIPKETVYAANASFCRSNYYILIGQHLEVILGGLASESSLERLGYARGQGALLALITFFQVAEGLTDIQAVDALRTRVDWKFALHLPLMPGMFHERMLCEFRQRMLHDEVCRDEFQNLINRLITCIPSLGNKIQNIKGLEMISLVCSVNRLNRAQQAMNQVLEILAARFPAWLRKIALPHWYGRYNNATPRLDVAILLGQQRFFVEEIRVDIHHLLEEIHRSGLPGIHELFEVQVLEQVWQQPFHGRTEASDRWPETLDSKNCAACASINAGGM
jgi:transposase